MAKTKKKARENERYEIVVHHWEVYHHLHAEKNMRDVDDGLYWEGSSVSLRGNLISPIIKSANKGNITINSKPQMDEHWKQIPRGKESEIIGFMDIPRGDNTLNFNAWVPNRLFQNIMLSLNQDKIKYVSIFGEKLKWRRGNFFSISLSTKNEDED